MAAGLRTFWRGLLGLLGGASGGPVTWREGETHAVEWTEASPLDPDGDAVTYRLQFSQAGDFSDAVTLAFGIASGVTAFEWTIPVGAISADTSTAKLRIRAEDSTGMVSAWSTTAAFAVLKDRVPTVSWVTPADEAALERGDVVLELAVADADDDRIHIEVEWALVANFSLRSGRLDSAAKASDFEHAASPYDTWGTLAVAGAVSGDHVRATIRLGRFDRYYLRARVTDGLVYSDWATIWVQTGPAADEVVAVTVGENLYPVESLRITERTGGEPSSMEMTLARSRFAAAPFQAGASLTVGLRMGGHARIWNGTVETPVDTGASVHVTCLMDDAYLQRKLATEDFEADDIGANLAALVDACGAPLDSAEIDTALGVDAEIVGGYQTVGKHMNDWAATLGLVLWVDGEGTVYLKRPEDCELLDYIIVEAEP